MLAKLGVDVVCGTHSSSDAYPLVSPQDCLAGYLQRPFSLQHNWFMPLQSHDQTVSYLVRLHTCCLNLLIWIPPRVPMFRSRWP